MTTVHKFKIAPKVKMPTGAVILKVAYDFNEGCACIWALVDTSQPMETRHFAMAKTGEEMAPAIADCPHLDTLVAAIPDGKGGVKTIVTHVWEVPNYLVKKKT
jgi:hypothetical protein